MKFRSTKNPRTNLFMSFIVLGLLSALIIVPYQFRSTAAGDDSAKRGLGNRIESQVTGLPNYDIREDKNNVASESLLRFRGESGNTASSLAGVREDFVRGEEELRSNVESLKVEYSPLLRNPEVISPDVYKSKVSLLTAPSSGKNTETLREFAKDYNHLFGMDTNQIDRLKVAADYTNPSGSMAFVNMTQEINGIPVFAGELKAGFTARGEIVRVINNLAPGLDYESFSFDFGNPASAVRAAAGHINYKIRTIDVTPNESASTDLKTVFGVGDWATTAERMYFPTEIGVARAAWRVLIWQPENAFYVIVDAETGTMLWRKNITEDQTTPSTYQVYVSPNGYINTADSPAPLTPGPVDPNTGTQGVIISSRTNRTLVGNEAPNWGMNDLGWITDGTNFTDGNNVEAGLDRVAPTGVDAPQPGDGMCPGDPGCRKFTSTWNPPPGSPPPGDDPLNPQAQRGGVIQMFYVLNLYHDVLYNLGFNEAAGNFQSDNFSRGGAAGDRVSAEGQDFTGTNGANMATPADGARPILQMFIWTGADPDRDGMADADVVIHEVTHGLSNRLHGNTTGLSNNMSRGMGEGWSDWYAHALLSESSDPINGIYTTGGYITYQISPGFEANFYYGIRRFPKAVIAFTGGPGNLPHNPLTFGNLNSGNCASFSSAFPRGLIGSAQCDQVHNAGEIWSSALWEVRALMVTRLGFIPGSKRALQVVTDGMKLSPLNPTFLQSRDAIIAAAAALPVAPDASADVADVREGFRRRGMGFSAQVIATLPANVVEAFDSANVQHIDPFSVSDSPGDNDGFPEPNENVLLSVPVTNTTGAAITNIFANANGGANVSYGNLNDGQTITMQIPYTVSNIACGAFEMVNINVSSSAGTQTPVARSFRVGAPAGGPPTTFTNATTINVPNGQPATTSGPASPNPSTITASGLSGDRVIKVELTNISHSWGADLDVLLEGPGGQKFIIMSDAFNASNPGPTVSTLTIRDGAVAGMPTGGNVPAGTGEFKPTNHGTGDTWDPPAPAGPYQSSAPGGTDTFLSVFGTNGASMNGDWKLWIDDDATGDFGTIGGWKITFESDSYVCSLAPPKPRADFDGDGKTDLSVFRPSEGNWYMNRSTDGFLALNWGIGSDTLVPADYDGDGKADTAVFRPSNIPGISDFYVLKSNGFTAQGAEWGSTGDIPLSADFTGDGKADPAVFRPSNGTWYVLDQTNGSNLINPFGQNGDIPMVVDNDGDGKPNLAVFRPGNNTWYIAKQTGTPSQNFDAYQFGAAGDKPVPADYDGDNKDDIAVFRPSNGRWYFLILPGGTSTSVAFGNSTDVPVPGDYDGDGKDDIAVYRGGIWFVNGSSSGVYQSNFGLSTDIAVPGKYIP